MLNEKETQRALETFFNDCIKFWKNIGFDERTAFEAALNDTKKLTTDPFMPKGKLLHEETRIKFIHYREMDLRR